MVKQADIVDDTEVEGDPYLNSGVEARLNAGNMASPPDIYDITIYYCPWMYTATPTVFEVNLIFAVTPRLKAAAKETFFLEAIYPAEVGGVWPSDLPPKPHSDGTFSGHYRRCHDQLTEAIQAAIADKLGVPRRNVLDLNAMVSRLTKDVIEKMPQHGYRGRKKVTDEGQD